MPHSPNKAEVATGAPASEAYQEPFPQLLPWLLLIGGLLGTAAASVLTVEKMARLRNPTYVPSCSLNPIISCGSVMDSPQATAFGFPNPLLGIAGFAVVTAVGAGLLAGARFQRWFWLGLQAGVTFGVVFVHWLIYHTLYSIGALCPYCIVVWAVTTPVFVYVTLRNLVVGVLPAPVVVRRLADVAAGYHGVALTIWALAIVALIGIRFWAYWSTLL
ncbi:MULTISPECIES: vitamin K epoxide reductase family protein [Nocardia]